MLLMIAAAVAALAQDRQPEPPTAATFAEARRALDEKLLDYPSARFKDVVAEKSVVCGSVNARNKLGAYTGWAQFAVVIGDDGPRLYEESDLLFEFFCTEDRRPRSADFSDRIGHR